MIILVLSQAKMSQILLVIVWFLGLNHSIVTLCFPDTKIKFCASSKSVNAPVLNEACNEAQKAPALPASLMSEHKDHEAGWK